MDLSPRAQRVLGCLIEKQLATPQHYPLTLNALRSACNQATNRDPVVAYDDETVKAALADLREHALTRTVAQTGSRTWKYEHLVPSVLGTDEAATAVTAVLLLRGPQTLNEIRQRTTRLHEFTSAEELQGCIDTLVAAGQATEVPRGPGQKEDRVTHVLGHRPEPDPVPDVAELTDELTTLHAAVERLETENADLRRRLALATGGDPSGG